MNATRRLICGLLIATLLLGGGGVFAQATAMPAGVAAAAAADDCHSVESATADCAGDNERCAETQCPQSHAALPVAVSGHVEARAAVLRTADQFALSTSLPPDDRPPRS